MSGVLQWQPKTTTESLYRYADFADELAPGETLESATTSATVLSGNDPAPAIIASTTVINNQGGVATVAQVKVQAGVLGTLYQVIVSGVTSLGNVITKTASLLIKPPLN
jgi:hypothetical protein